MKQIACKTLFAVFFFCSAFMGTEVVENLQKMGKTTILVMNTLLFNGCKNGGAPSLFRNLGTCLVRGTYPTGFRAVAVIRLLL